MPSACLTSSPYRQNCCRTCSEQPGDFYPEGISVCLSVFFPPKDTKPKTEHPIQSVGSPEVRDGEDVQKGLPPLSWFPGRRTPSDAPAPAHPPSCLILLPFLSAKEACERGRGRAALAASAGVEVRRRGKQTSVRTRALTHTHTQILTHMLSQRK